MKLVNNNISPLPFYSDLDFQNHRKDYAFGQVYRLIVYRNIVLPFQVVLSDFGNIDYIKIYSLSDLPVVDATESFIENGLKIIQISDTYILKYPGILPVAGLVHEGLYYLEISIDGNKIYSDVFCVTNSVDNCLLIEYKNSDDFLIKGGVIDFSENFTFKCYLETQIGKPEYVFEEEATERMGYTFIESQVSKKIYKFTFVAPEYLCDALRIVRLCDKKSITSKGHVYDLTSFSMNPEWQDQGDLAAVECEFETDTVIANIGGYVKKPLGGDFNNDFNNDFNKE